MNGLAAVQWPGRLAVLGRAPLVVVDGAHNPAGVAALARELPPILGDRRVTLVFAVMADKAWHAMLEMLGGRVARVLVTRVGRRGLDPTRAAERVAGWLPVEAVADPAVRKRLTAELGQDIPSRAQLTPEALYAYQKAEIEKWWPLIKSANIRPE